MNTLYKLPFTNFAQTYGCDAYGAGDYNTCPTDSTPTVPSTPVNSTGSSLADTGITVGIFVVIAVAIMAIAVTIRFWRRKK